MQAAGLNALIALAAGDTAGNRADATVGNDDDAAAGQQFAQLLSDHGGSYEEQAATQTPLAQMALNGSSGLLAAQEINGAKIDGARQLLPVADKTVTPADAAALIKKIDGMLAQQGQTQGDASQGQTHATMESDAAVLAETPVAEPASLAPLKEQLQAIVASGTPKSLSAIMNALPKQGRQALNAINALFAGIKATAKPNAQAEEEASAATETAVAASSVPAAMFRPDLTAHAATGTAATPHAHGKKKKTGDVDALEAIVTPPVTPSPLTLTAAAASASTAGTLVAPPITDSAVPVDTIMPAATAATAPMTEDEKKALAALDAQSAPVSDDITVAPLETRMEGPLRVRADLDDAVPPLTLAKDNETLHIDLPQAFPASPLQADAGKDATAMASTLMPLKTGDAVTDAKGVASSDAKPLTANDVANAMNASQVNGHSTTQTLQAMQPTNAAAALAAHSAVTKTPVSEQVNVAISKASKDGIDKITIQLEPYNLGRVEVQMHTTKEGQTHIAFTVDKPETFDSLSRDARSLERSLQEAGIKADTGSMQFNMRQQSQQQQLQSNLNGDGQSRSPQGQVKKDEQASAAPAAVSNVASLTRNYQLTVREGVDISA